MARQQPDEKHTERLLVQMKALHAACPLPQVGDLTMVLGRLLSPVDGESATALRNLLVMTRIFPELRTAADPFVETYLEMTSTAVRGAVFGK